MFSDMDNKLHLEKNVKLTQKREKHQWPVVPPDSKVRHNLMTGQVEPDLVLGVALFCPSFRLLKNVSPCDFSIQNM